MSEPVREIMVLVEGFAVVNGRRPQHIDMGYPFFLRLVDEIAPEPGGAGERVDLGALASQRAGRAAMLAGWGREGSVIAGARVHARSALGNEVRVR